MATGFRFPFDIQSTLDPWRHKLGSSFDAVVAHLSDRDRALEDYMSRAAPTGSISLWFGAATAVPAGWAICDGTNGTPDMRDRVPVGAGVSYALGATGGEATHVLTVAEMPGHTHDLNGRPDDATSTGSFFNDVEQTTQAIQQTSTTSTGGGVAHNNLQPYLALHFIMWLGH